MESGEVFMIFFFILVVVIAIASAASGEGSGKETIDWKDYQDHPIVHHVADAIIARFGTQTRDSTTKQLWFHFFVTGAAVYYDESGEASHFDHYKEDSTRYVFESHKYYDISDHQKREIIARAIDRRVQERFRTENQSRSYLSLSGTWGIKDYGGTERPGYVYCITVKGTSFESI